MFNLPGKYSVARLHKLFLLHFLLLGRSRDIYYDFRSDVMIILFNFTYVNCSVTTCYNVNYVNPVS
jgi:hypothetical protein